MPPSRFIQQPLPPAMRFLVTVPSSTILLVKWFLQGVKNQQPVAQGLLTTMGPTAGAGSHGVGPLQASEAVLSTDVIENSIAACFDLSQEGV